MGAKSGNVRQLNKKEFKQKIYDYTFSQEWNYKGDKPAVIDFYADWCQPCKVVAPMLNQLSEEYEGRVDFYKVNTEKDPAVAKAFGITNIPTILFIPMEGRPVSIKGAKPKIVLKRNVEKILPGDGKGFSLKNLFSFNRKNDN
jgi:thioredoxin